MKRRNNKQNEFERAHKHMLIAIDKQRERERVYLCRYVHIIKMNRNILSIQCIIKVHVHNFKLPSS